MEECKAWRVVAKCFVTMRLDALNFWTMKSKYWFRIEFLYLLLIFLSFSSSKAANVKELPLGELLRISKIDTNQHVKMRVYNLLLDHYLFVNGDSAKYYADLALSLAPKVMDDTLEVMVHNNLSIHYATQMQFDKALATAFKVLEKSEAIKEYTMVGNAENNIAGFYFQLKKYEEAEKFLRRSAKTRLEVGDSTGVAATLLNLGAMQGQIGKNAEALESLKTAYDIADALNDDRLIAAICANMSAFLMDLQRYEEAGEYIHRSIVISERTNNKTSMRSAYEKLGKLYKIKGELDSAIVYLGFGLQLGDEMKDFQGHRGSYELLAEIHEKKGEYNKAIQYLHLAQKIIDSTFSRDLDLNVAKYQVQYETQKLNQEKMLALAEKGEIALALKAQEAENQVANLVLSRTRYIIVGLLIVIGLLIAIFVILQMRSKLKNQVRVLELKQSILQGQMNPHFIFNALNSIQNQILNRDRREAYEYHSKFSELMRTVLEASNRISISLEDEIDATSNYLALERLRTDEKFEFSIHIDPKLDMHSTMVPPLLIQPFVENSVWHGLIHKEGKGHIQIDISPKSSGILYRITDDGIGRERSAEINKMKTKSHESRGVNVTNDRIRYHNLTHGRQLEMKITDLYDSAGLPNGTCVEIEIPYL